MEPAAEAPSPQVVEQWPHQFEQPSLETVIQHYLPLKSLVVEIKPDSFVQELGQLQESASMFVEAPRLVDPSLKPQYVQSLEEVLPGIKDLLMNTQFLHLIASKDYSAPSFDQLSQWIQTTLPGLSVHNRDRITCMLKYNCDPEMMRLNTDYLRNCGKFTDIEAILAQQVTQNSVVLKSYFEYLQQGGARNFVVGSIPGTGKSELSYSELRSQWTQAALTSRPELVANEINRSIDSWFTAPGNAYNPKYEEASLLKLGFGNIDGLFFQGDNPRKLEVNVQHGSCIAHDIQYFAFFAEQGMYLGSVIKKVITLWHQHFPQLPQLNVPMNWIMDINHNLLSYMRNQGLPLDAHLLDNGFWEEKTQTLGIDTTDTMEKPGKEMFFENILVSSGVEMKRIINDMGKVTHELTHQLLETIFSNNNATALIPSVETAESVSDNDIWSGPYRAVQEGLAVLMEQLMFSAIISSPTEIGCTLDDCKDITAQIIARRDQLAEEFDSYHNHQNSKKLLVMPYAEGFLKIFWPLFVNRSVSVDGRYDTQRGLNEVFSFIQSIDPTKLLLLTRDNQAYTSLIHWSDSYGEEWYEIFQMFQKNIGK